MNITKVELLWSRDCKLRCTGCAMPNQLREEQDHPIPHLGTLAEWTAGIQRMRELGAGFVAIYGAEPLLRMELLPQVIRSIYQNGMKATVITAMGPERIRPLLQDAPCLDSLTVSYDSIAPDLHREAKGKLGLMALQEFELEDKACVATVTQLNVDNVADMAKRASNSGFWFLFDLIHYGHSSFSKCTRRPFESDLTPYSTNVRRMARSLLELKRDGYKIHASEQFLTALAAEYNGNPRDFWHCQHGSTGWITVDSDGSILPCDDWQEVFPLGKIWDSTWTTNQLAHWKKQSVRACPGCAWNTHFDAVGIEDGTVPITSYIHAKE